MVSAPTDTTTEFRLSEVLSALSYALDITEGQPVGHAVRTCLIGMRIAEVAGAGGDRSALFYALLMKDLGCSSNAARVGSLFGADDLDAKRDHKLTDWSRRIEAARYAVRVTGRGRGGWRRALTLLRLGVAGERDARTLTKIRCERGADIAAMLGFPEGTSAAIRTLDEHWNARGYPLGLRGVDIPLFGRILCLAQTAEVFFTVAGLDTAMSVATDRSGAWFDPDLVRALLATRRDAAFWSRLGSKNLLRDVVSIEPAERVTMASEARLDQVAEAFARVIDAKSPWTSRHSERVAQIALRMADGLDVPRSAVRDLRRASLLHDIGKLGVSNAILDTPDRLTEAQWATVRRHPAHTVEILTRVAPFRSIAAVAGAHHERLDGSGYHRQLTGPDLSRPARILAVADVFEALTAERPYRGTLSTEQALAIVRSDSPHRLCPTCVDALAATVGEGRA